MNDLFAILSLATHIRFHQQGSTPYCCENFITYPRISCKEGVPRFEITGTASHHGVQSRLVVSALVYSKLINSGPIPQEGNIATLCHAFLYAIDLDRDESETLAFGIPYSHPSHGFQLMPARARICRDDRKEYIFIELAEE